MPDLLLGIDVGTYSTKGVLADPSGTIIGSASAPNTVDFPRPGWAEQHPEQDWWASLCTVSKQLLTKPGIAPSDIAAVGVSAIGPCMVPLDHTGDPLRPAILYGVDTRASEQITQLEREIGRDEIEAWSGMELSSQAIGPKIAWYRQNEPDRWNRTAHITTASSYLTWRLTESLVIDHHQAAHFIPLYDRTAQSWSDHYATGICPPEMLPALQWSDEIAGAVTAEASRATALPIGTPVVTGTVDALSEAVSIGALSVGDLMLMYGSTAFLILTTSEPANRPPLWSLPGAFADSHVVAAGMATTGSLTRWLADLTAGNNTDGSSDIGAVYARLFQEAATVPAGSEGVLILPYFSGERTPINDPRARGVVAGLSLAHGSRHLFRAALEGVAYGIRHNLETMDPDGTKIARCVAVGGGTQGDVWLQIVSDVTGRRQYLPEKTIGASYGDAYLAGLGTGVVTPDQHEQWVSYRRIVKPNPSTESFYHRGYDAFRSLYKATRSIVHDLAEETAPALGPISAKSAASGHLGPLSGYGSTQTESG